MLAKWHIDHIGHGFDLSMDQCQISLSRATMFELSSQSPVGGIRLGEDHDAGRVSVEPMNDTRPGFLTPDIGQFARGSVSAMPCQAIHQRASLVASGWMDDDLSLIHI